MDPVRNPFAPGAGTRPPELAGRDPLRENVRIAIDRIRLGRPAKSVLMVGLRGVGKTVLLDRMCEDARAAGIQTVRLEAPEGRSLPAMLAPQLRGQTGEAKSYAERLFDFPEVGPLDPADARRAIEKPIRDEHEQIEDAAVERIIAETRGYPYFLQEWGKHAWDAAAGSPITLADVEAGARIAVAALDESFFRVRFDRLTPLEKRYLRAMAELGPGPHRSGDVAGALGKKVTSLAPTRNQLIAKGMIWSPAHGDTAFTVPLFDEFLRRVMPGDDWRK